jgi:hypothetical protein
MLHQMQQLKGEQSFKSRTTYQYLELRPQILGAFMTTYRGYLRHRFMVMDLEHHLQPHSHIITTVTGREHLPRLLQYTTIMALGLLLLLLLSNTLPIRGNLHRRKQTLILGHHPHLHLHRIAQLITHINPRAPIIDHKDITPHEQHLPAHLLPEVLD